MDPITVISLDSYLVPFIRANVVTLGLLLPILKVIAKATPWSWDDEILQIITEFKNRKVSEKKSKKEKR